MLPAPRLFALCLLSASGVFLAQPLGAAEDPVPRPEAADGFHIFAQNTHILYTHTYIIST